MLFQRFVEVGRLVWIRYGKHEGKLAVIVDFVTSNRVLVDGPTTGVLRQPIPVRWLELTDFKIKNMTRTSPSRVIVKGLEKEGVMSAFWESSTGKKKSAMIRKAGLTDFERFKVVAASKRRNAIMAKMIKASA